jgi:hypothetical protein
MCQSSLFKYKNRNVDFKYIFTKIRNKTPMSKHPRVKQSDWGMIVYPVSCMTPLGHNDDIHFVCTWNKWVIVVYHQVNTVSAISWRDQFAFRWWCLLNTVVSNHFHSVKILLFSSARSRDFDELIGIELPVSMYTTKTPIDMCRFNVRSSILKNLSIFCKRQISIKLFYLYQRLQCRDKYFFKIKFVFFPYLRLSASSMENDLPFCIYFWYQTDSEVPNTSIYLAVSLASPYYNYL